MENEIRHGNPQVLQHPELNIATAHDAIKTYLRSQFPNPYTVDAYARPGDKVPVPAIYFQLDGLEAADDDGTDQLSVVLTWSAEIVCSYKAGQKLNVRLEAAKLARVIHDEKFGLPMTPAKIVSALPESFSLGTTGREDLTTEYESWRVTWTNQCYLGPCVWDYSEIIPTTVYFGDVPRIGEGYPDDYQKGNRT